MYPYQIVVIISLIGATFARMSIPRLHRHLPSPSKRFPLLPNPPLAPKLLFTRLIPKPPVHLNPRQAPQSSSTSAIRTSAAPPPPLLVQTTLLLSSAPLATPPGILVPQTILISRTSSPLIYASSPPAPLVQQSALFTSGPIRVSATPPAPLIAQTTLVTGTAREPVSTPLVVSGSTQLLITRL
jgi:hypothetical protein